MKTFYAIVDSDGEAWETRSDPEEARTVAYNLEAEYDEPFYVKKIRS